MNKVLGAFSRFKRRKTKLFAVKFRRILEVLRLQGLQRNFWVEFSLFLCPKTKLFAVKFRRILEVFALTGFMNKFYAHFYDLCVEKRSGLPWSSGGF